MAHFKAGHKPDLPDAVQRARVRFAQAGLGPLVDALGEGLRPLAPLAAQLLWLGQPLFALFEQGPLAGELANLLDSPGAHTSTSQQEKDEQTR